MLEDMLLQAVQPVIMTFLMGVCAMVVMAKHHDLDIELPKGLFPLVIVIGLAATLPYLLRRVSFSLPDFVVYLSEPSLDLVRILLVTLLGGVLVSLVVLVLSKQRR